MQVLSKEFGLVFGIIFMNQFCDVERPLVTILDISWQLIDCLVKQFVCVLLEIYLSVFVDSNLRSFIRLLKLVLVFG